MTRRRYARTSWFDVVLYGVVGLLWVLIGLIRVDDTVAQVVTVLVGTSLVGLAAYYLCWLPYRRPARLYGPA